MQSTILLAVQRDDQGVLRILVHIEEITLFALYPDRNLKRRECIARDNRRENLSWPFWFEDFTLRIDPRKLGVHTQGLSD